MATTESESPALEVLAQLQLDLDGHVATLTGSGEDLVLVASDPAALLDQLATAAIPVGVGQVDGPRALGLVADILGQAGLRLTVQGPNGTLVTLGRGQASYLGRLLTGSERAQPGTVRSLAPLVRAIAVQRLGRERLLGIAGLVAVILALASLRRKSDLRR